MKRSNPSTAYRLRRYAQKARGGTSSLCIEAAEEIERLRLELKEAAKRRRRIQYAIDLYVLHAKARAAKVPVYAEVAEEVAAILLRATELEGEER